MTKSRTLRIAMTLWGNGHVGRMLIVGSQHFTERQSGGLQCACF